MNWVRSPFDGTYVYYSSLAFKQKTFCLTQCHIENIEISILLNSNKEEFTFTFVSSMHQFLLVFSLFCKISCRCLPIINFQLVYFALIIKDHLLFNIFIKAYEFCCVKFTVLSSAEGFLYMSH